MTGLDGGENAASTVYYGSSSLAIAASIYFRIHKMVLNYVGGLGPMTFCDAILVNASNKQRKKKISASPLVTKVMIRSRKVKQGCLAPL